VDDKPCRDFDADALTVKLPDSKQSVRVKATITPVKG